VAAIVAALVVAFGLGSTGPKKAGGNSFGESTSARYSVTNVANLAGADTFAASGPYVWISVIGEPHGEQKLPGVVELNTKTGGLVRIIKNHNRDLTEPGAVAIGRQDVWVADDQYGNVTELNTETGALVRVIKGPADDITDPSAIGVEGGHVWVASGEEGANTVTELNAATGELIRVINAPADRLKEPDDIVTGNGRVWVLNSNGDSITELNAATGGLIRVVSAHAGCCAYRSGSFESAEPTLMTLSGAHLWVADVHDYANGGTSVTSLVELNAVNGSLERVVRGNAYKLSFPSGVVVVDGHVWVQSQPAVLTEIDAATGRLMRVVSVRLAPHARNSPDGLTLSGSHLVVLNIYSDQKGSVTLINQKDGKIVGVIR
jgi:outer membrane protein assembly factor BamB